MNKPTHCDSHTPRPSNTTTIKHCNSYTYRSPNTTLRHCHSHKLNPFDSWFTLNSGFFSFVRSVRQIHSSFVQSVGSSVGLSESSSVSPPVSCSIIHLVGQSTSRSVSQLVSFLVNRPIIKTVGRSIARLVSCSDDWLVGRCPFFCHSNFVAHFAVADSESHHLPLLFPGFDEYSAITPEPAKVTSSF